jgi:hypothetical protein
MRGLLLLTLCGLMSACAMVSEVKGPDGRTAYAINCGINRAMCLQQAGERCPSGYDVVDDSSMIFGTRGYITSQTVLTVSCRGGQ